MKKFTSFLLMLTMLISIIYLPGLTFNISAAYADDAVNVTLPEGVMSTSGVFEDSISGYTAISTAAQFKTIKEGGKYYLTKNIDLTASGVNFAALSDFADATIGGDTSKAIILDGRGHKIKTNRPLFRSLANGSEIRNLVVQGAVTSPDYNTYSGWCLGAVATRSYGTTFKNILNQASVTYTNTSSPYIRTGGLVGMALIGTTIFQNCKNTGNVTMGKTDVVADATTRGGAGGILGYAHNGSVLMANCHNQSKVINNLKTDYDSAGNKIGAYAGGLVGVKGTSATLCIALDNVDDNGNTFNPVYSQNNTSADYTITGKSAQSTYCPNVDGTDPNRELYVGELYRLSSGSEFISLSGNGKYYLTKNISIDNVQSHNVFSGKIYGLNRTITCTEPPFADMSKFTSKNLTIRVSGWTEIKTAAQFANIVNNGTAVDWNSKANTENKYYLAANIDLATSYPNWKGPSYWSGSDGNRKHAVNNQPTIFLDGCGFTVTTARPIFPELPGGGPENDGTHSTIRNLVVAGNVSVNKSYLTEYNNGYSAAALVGKSNGGIYENVTNNANILLTTDMSARVGGIIGSVFNDDITIKNCVNNGTVTAPISGELHGVGGILGLIGYNVDGSARGVHATLINCVNKGTVKNTSTSSSYAGGIIGVKYVNETTAFLLDCSNSGKIFAQTAYGSYYANRLQQNVHVIKTTPITTADEFMKMSGKKAYSLAADITLSSFNTNEFSGFLVGNGHTVTTPDRMFDYAPDARVVDTNIKLTSVVINGHKLGGFKVIAASKTDANAQKIVARFATYGANIEILTPADNYVGDAIYINLGNTYGNVRSGIDWEFTDDGDFHIYLDDSASIGTLVDRFLANNMPAGKSNFDFFSTFGEKNFTYNFGSAKSQGYTFTEREDGIRYLANGVRYISRDYTTSSGIAVNADILIIEANADAHVEVGAAASTTVSSCTNSANCDKIHVVPQTTTQLAESLRADGRRVIAAVNGGFFMRSAGLKYGCYTPWGMQIVDGVVNREPTNTTSALPYSNWFAITNEGKPVIGDFNDYNSTYKGKDLLKFGIGGKQFIMRNGKYIPNTSSTETSDAKTAIGYNAKGDIVIVSISGNDNDLTKHPGATLADVAQVFMDLDVDVTNILNLDGGGSTTMVFENSNNEIVRGSVQYGTTDNKVERPVSDIVAIVLNK